MPKFVAGLDLAQAFYEEIVRPLLGARPHAAALLGTGSDVLGLDTERSTDHGWGPRLQVFVPAPDRPDVEALIEAGLPSEFRGSPTRFGWDDVRVGHHVTVADLGAWLNWSLGFDPTSGITKLDWVTTPQQLLLQVTAGRVFHDGLDGELGRVRDALAWYPDGVWMWLLACQWRRLSQEEAFPGRAAEVGDEIGSMVVAARQVRELIRLWFLMERRYAPYSKWLGSAFAALDGAAEIAPHLRDALTAGAYPERQEALSQAYEAAARRHNGLGVTPPIDVHVRPFHGRPFLVLGCDRFVDACLTEVRDPWLESLPMVGSVDQFADSTDILSHGERPRRLAAVYGAVVDAR